MRSRNVTSHEDAWLSCRIVMTTKYSVVIVELVTHLIVMQVAATTINNVMAWLYIPVIDLNVLVVFLSHYLPANAEDARSA